MLNSLAHENHTAADSRHGIGDLNQGPLHSLCDLAENAERFLLAPVITRQGVTAWIVQDEVRMIAIVERLDIPSTPRIAVALYNQRVLLYTRPVIHFAFYRGIAHPIFLTGSGACAGVAY